MSIQPDRRRGVGAVPDGSRSLAPLRERHLCFIDIETTGSVFSYHEIIQIAAIRTTASADRILGTWSWHVQPAHPERVTEFARQLTGFDPSASQLGRVPDRAFWQEFGVFAGGCVPVCHNPSFERAFITLSAWSAGISDLGLDYHWIGTESLAWPLYVAGRIETLSLAGIARALGIEPEPEVHAAMAGADSCRRVYSRLLDLSV